MLTKESNQVVLKDACILCQKESPADNPAHPNLCLDCMMTLFILHTQDTRRLDIYEIQ